MSASDPTATSARIFVVMQQGSSTWQSWARLESA
jgi:hypothetical protein